MVERSELWYHLLPGEGRPIIFIHGAGSNHSIWKPYVPHFKGRRMLLIDLPGHGNSQHVPYSSLSQAAIEVAKIIRKEDLRNVTFVGQSLGAIIASETCRSHPGLARQAILIGPFSSGLVKMPQACKAIALAARLFSPTPRGRKPFQDYTHLFGSPLWTFPIVDLKGTHAFTYFSSISDLLRHELNLAGLNAGFTVIIGSDDRLISHDKITEAVKSNGGEVKLVPCHHLVVTHAKDHLVRELKRVIA